MMTKATPAPGQPLSEADVSLLQPGDFLLRKGRVVVFRNQTHLSGWVSFTEMDGTTGSTMRECLCFLGRPDQDGWIAWEGGENPVPGQMVDVRHRSFDTLREPPFHRPHEVWAEPADEQRWTHLGDNGDIIAYRPHAPVSCPGDGVEGERDMSGETFAGFRVAAWRYRQAGETDKLPHHYAEHWSTPGASAWGIQRLFTEDQLLAALNPPAEPASRPAGEGEREAVARIRELEQWQANAIRSARLHDENVREIDARATAAEAKIARAIEALLSAQNLSRLLDGHCSEMYKDEIEEIEQTLAALQQEGE